MTTIKLKNGSGAPTAGDLVQGEPALDLTNKRLYTEDSGGTVIEVGTNPGTDVTFADNIALRFGSATNGDLVIKHDGSDSSIVDRGDGDLLIQGSTNVKLQNFTGSKDYFVGSNGGASTVYYDGSQKLATTSTGIDVTGGIAATDDSTFTAASGDIYVTASTPTGAARSGFRVDETANNGFEIAHDNADNAFFISRRSGSSTVVDALKIDRSTGDFSLFENTGTTPKLFWDASAERLGIGNSSPATALDVTGTVTADGLTVDGSDSNIKYNVASSDPHANPTFELKNQNATDGNIAALKLSADNTNGVSGSAYVYAQSETANQKGNLVFAREDGANTPVTSMKLSSNGDISFYEDTGTTAKLFWDAAAESLGIGTTSSIDQKLTLVDTADVGIKMLKTGSGTGTIRTVGGGMAFGYDGGSGTTERMRIDSSGRVGIGTNSPVSPLHVDSGADGNIIHANGAVNAWDFILKGTNDGDVNSVLYELGMYRDDGATNPNTVLKFGRGTGAQNGFFAIDQNGSEAMRIDSSGNLLVGTTNSSIETSSSTEGVNILPDKISVARSAGVTANFNRISTDGNIVQFRKDGTTVGSIATNSSRFELDGSGNPVRMKAGTSNIQVNNNTHISFDTAGNEAARFDTSGNLLVGTTDTPTSSAGNIVLANGTAPTASATDGVILYAEDVSSSSELKVRDEAGNITTLSPHNFDLIPQGPSEDMAWSYYSERDGKQINVDMLKAIRVLEKLSGEQLVFEN